MALKKAEEIQKQYYTTTASQYDTMHIGKGDEHFFSLSFLLGVLDFLDVRSILDVGSGTGRALRFLKEHCPEIKIVGIEPVEALREIGYANGLSKHELIDGDATQLNFDDGAFDLVCEFGVLHHIRKPELAVKEMLRVADKAIFISDSNNFGQGTWLSRSAKQVFNFVGMWKIIDLIKTKGKGYSITEGDGLAYSYSVFNNYKLIKAHCRRIHILNTIGNGINPYKTAGHLALLGIK